ncbi:hypothetical protein D9M68_961780 [compost metagenome]
MAHQVLDEQLLELFIAVDVLEHVAAVEGQQADGLVAAVAARGQVDALAQAHQVAFLQVEERTIVDHGVQQAVLDQEQLVGRQQRCQVLGLLQAQGRAGWLHALEQLPGDTLQAVDQLVGVGRLLPE